MSNAGRSAGIRARELRWEISAFRIYGSKLIIAAPIVLLLALFKVRNGGIYWILTVFVVYLFGSAYQNRETSIDAKRNEIARWASGARAERLSAAQFRWRLFLMRLRGDRWYILHDRQVPGRDENIDHILISSRGCAVVDTKSRMRGKWSFRDKQLVFKHRPISTKTTMWEAQFVGSAIKDHFKTYGVPLRIYWALHTNGFPGAQSVDGVVLCESNRVIRQIAANPKVLTAQQVTEIAHYVDRAFPKVA